MRRHNIENTSNSVPLDFSKIQLGIKRLDDAILNLGTYRTIDSRYGNKNFVLQAITHRDIKTLQEISNYFYESSGIYQRACKYLAYLYRWDWYVDTCLTSKTVKEDKVINATKSVLRYLDNSQIKRTFDNITLEIIKNGSFYGIILDLNDKFAIQQLPSEFCRSRFMCGNDPAIELNMRFFDSYFTDVQYRMKVLKMFPKEIQKAYVLYKEGKLVEGTERGWVLLDPQTSIKFNIGNTDFPILINSIPSIIDLDSAQDLDRQKTMQQLLKIIIQKVPLDKNGDLQFDGDEIKDLHNTAVQMLKRAIGVDVLTTFADISVEDMHDGNSITSKDDLEKVERTVYNNLGISKNLFNAEGNLASTNSIVNDEATMRELLYQYKSLLNKVVSKFNKSQYYFDVSILETTVYNYKELSKMYKEQVAIGYSKMLPQIALGHSQSSILASAEFENQILNLSNIMIPPYNTNTMSGKQLSEVNSVGRPQKEDNEKSEKTIANEESMN